MQRPMSVNTARGPGCGYDPETDLTAELESRVVGQAAAIRSIVPYVEMFQANLSPAGRPVGVFLLLGPTGTGKTKTVEALAEVLHGSEKNMLKVDCGEFQMEHEVARLIGAPPGYLGHRETQPMITQQKLNATTSRDSSISIVLFDEVEKAAVSLTRLLLGVLDKANLNLGDNTAVNFENSLICLTSNVGARDMFREIRPTFGYSVAVSQSDRSLAEKLGRIGMSAIRRRFSPEFINRIDSIITYEPLGRQTLETILDQQLSQFQQLVFDRLEEDAFDMVISDEATDFLLREGSSPEFGARELKRTIHRHVVQPVSARVSHGELPAGETVQIHISSAADSIEILTREEAAERREENPDLPGEALRLTA
ncbi:MAG: ATP-dependent Clp protease ATP-binding subunit [bacterium]|nr:ATP-dependent Clp protease ATP-binding subunit [bacterium]